MQKSNMRVCSNDDFAIEFEYQSEHTVRGRVLGPEVDCVVADFSTFGRFTFVNCEVCIFRVVWLLSLKTFVNGYESCSFANWFGKPPLRRCGKASCEGAREGGGSGAKALGGVGGESNER